MQSNNSKNPQGSAMLRLLIGGYLVYLAYDLIRSDNRTPLIIAASVVFLLAGGAVAALSLRTLLMQISSAQPPAQSETNNNQECEGNEDEQ